jgi:hypothetical protein
MHLNRINSYCIKSNIVRYFNQSIFGGTWRKYRIDTTGITRFHFVDMVSIGRKTGISKARSPAPISISTPMIGIVGNCLASVGGRIEESAVAVAKNKTK